MQNLFASLAAYIPIIQLFIGNGPLVFFQKKFENRLTTDYNELIERYQDFFYKNQAALHDQESHFNRTLNGDIDWLINSENSIIALAIISFVYCMSLMFYAIGEPNFDSETVAGALFVVAILYVIYNAVILTFFGRNNIQHFRDWWGRGLVSTIFVFILCFFCKLSWSVKEWMHIVYMIALLSGFVGIIAVWLGIFFRNRFLDQRLSCMEEMSQKMDIITTLRQEILQSIDPKLDGQIIEKIKNFIPRLSAESKEELLAASLETGLIKNKILTILEREIVAIYKSIMSNRIWWYWSYSIE